MKKICLIIFSLLICMYIQISAETITAEVSVNCGIITITGIAGKTAGVALTIVKKGMSASQQEYLYAVRQTTSNSEGKFSFIIEMPDEKSGISSEGDCTVSFKSDGNFFSKDIYYTTAQGRINLIKEMENKTADYILSMMEDASDDFEKFSGSGFAMDVYKKFDIATKRQIVEKFMLKVSYDGYNDAVVSKVFNQAVAVAGINNAAEGAKAEEILERFMGILNLEIKGVKYSDCEKEQKGWVANVLYKNKPFEWTEQINDCFGVALALDELNSAQYSQMERTLEKWKDILKIENNSEYLKYLIQKSKTKINEAVVLSLRQKNAEKVSEFLNVFEKAVRDNADTQPTVPSSGPGASKSSGNNNIAVSQTVDNIPEDNNTEPVGFSDIDGSFWAKDSIMNLSKKGLINGYKDNTFKPNNNITRAEFIKILVSALGVYDSDSSSEFEDAKGHWAESYIASAVTYGIVNGMGNGLFGTESEISRQDMAVMIYRAMIIKGIELNFTADMTAFTDSDEIEEYAKESVSALQRAGIISGYEDASFGPNEKCTRAQCAKVIDFII